MQVKANQKGLLEACIRRTKINRDYSTAKTINKSHGRLETREVIKFKGLAVYDKKINKGWLGDIVSILKVKRTRFILKDKSLEISISYYVSNLDLPVKQFLKIIRAYWKIENVNHGVRDNIIGEDKSRIRVKAENMAILRSWALNILRANGVKSVKEARFVNALNPLALINFRFFL